MSMPVVSGLIRRWVLLNYRADPTVVKKLLPDCFTPILVRGCAMVGVCLIRLEAIRPFGLPAYVGVDSENVAHRIAVAWTDPQGERCSGTFITRRDTNSHLIALAGGRLFSGHHHHASFEVVMDTTKRVVMRVLNKSAIRPIVEFAGRPCSELPRHSVFKTLTDASKFFEQATSSYSVRPNSLMLDGVKLQIDHWRVSPLRVSAAYSTFYDNTSIFPRGTIQFDHALLMREVPHRRTRSGHHPRRIQCHAIFALTKIVVVFALHRKAGGCRAFS